jgi:hypothetical protein
MKGRPKRVVAAFSDAGRRRRGGARMGGRRRKTSKGGNRGKGDEGGSSRAMGICVPRMLRVIEYETMRGVGRRGCGF